MELSYNHDPRFTEWVVRKGLLESPFVFIDVGVQGGIHPRWLHLGPSLRVYGFDPLEETIGPLTRLNLPNHTYQAIALGDADGERDFFVPGESFPRLHFFRARPSRIRCAWRSTLRSNWQGIQTRRMPMRKLDTLLAEGAIPPADFIKIDCEGFEPAVLKVPATF
jgi:FkbM family methyltransferase